MEHLSDFCKIVLFSVNNKQALKAAAPLPTPRHCSRARLPSEERPTHSPPLCHLLKSPGAPPTDRSPARSWHCSEPAAGRVPVPGTTSCIQNTNEWTDICKVQGEWGPCDSRNKTDAHFDKQPSCAVETVHKSDTALAVCHPRHA